jgi:5-methylcytosine-specific restriction protein A
VATFLFAWNPNKWHWKDDDLTNQVLRVADTGSAEDSWSCGNRKELPVGSRFFLIRLGQEPKGIVGSGYTTSDPEIGPHWDSILARQGKEGLFVDLDFDFLSKQPLISWNELQRSPFSKFSWGIQASGVRLPETIALQLERLWTRRTSGSDALLPEEFPAVDTTYPEGAKRRVSINAYEHNAQARAACVAHFGFRCSVHTRRDRAGVAANVRILANLRRRVWRQECVQRPRNPSPVARY